MRCSTFGCIRDAANLVAIEGIAAPAAICVVCTVHAAILACELRAPLVIEALPPAVEAAPAATEDP